MRKIIVTCALLCAMSARAQTSKDIFVMPGSDFVRPGLHPRVNLNIGLGVNMKSLKRVPVGDELTAAYTYENGGSHGFWHTDHGSHTESIGLMKNIALSMSVGMYTWVQYGLTSFTGGKVVQNREYTGEALGLAYHFTDHQAVWVQTTYNKINTVPWYVSENVGYVWSW